jgi:uncharacterized protein (TIGR04222 family)
MPLNPLDWTAGPFLTLYLTVALAIIWICIRLRGQMGGLHPVSGTLDPLQLAYLSGGPQRFGDALLVELLTSGAATVSSDGRKIEVSPSVRWLKRSDEAFGSLLTAGPMTRQQFQRRIAGRIEDVKANLQQRGLSPLPSQIWDYHRRVWLLLIVPVALGICKVHVGIERNKPVGILIVLICLTIFAGFLLMKTPRTTRGGEEMVRDHKRKNARAARAPLENELVLAVALTGLVALAGTDYAPVYHAAKAEGAGGCGGGSGCGGGGGGGGGCGCGGGCGGCGGS